MSKIFISLLSLFLLISCKTTENLTTVKLETKITKIENEIGKLEEILKKEKKEVVTPLKQKEVLNPLEQMETIPPGLVLKSAKSVFCGEAGELMTNMVKKFEEMPVLLGEVPVNVQGENKKYLFTILYNSKTKSFTILEQMPADPRFLCMLTQGKVISMKKELLFPGDNL